MMVSRFWIRGIVFLIAAGFFLPGEAWAQKRVFAKVEPNIDPTSQISFDVNVDSSDNISPNIVFSPDGKRGFVAYTGSGIVLVFSTETGEILNRIQTGGKPFFSTPLQDKRTLAVVSIQDNKVFLVNMESEAVAASYSFTNAQFGFGSIVTISADDAVGYVSSTGTGEVIKFNVADGRESGRLRGLAAPTQITLSLDGSTIMVVDTLTEELVFVEASTMTRKTALKGKDPGINFTIFNKAVLSPDGGTGIITSRDNNGILGSDTVFYFRTATGEILDTATIGADPAYTTLTPDGKNWVILNQFSLSVISTEDFKARKELATPGGDPLGSANVVFSRDSRYAFYVSSSDDWVLQHDLITSAVVARIVVGDNPDQALDQASSLAMAPDGRIIAVLNFISNNVELLTDAWVLDAAKFISSADNFTSLSLLNLSRKPATFKIFAFNNFGDLVTENGVQNPTEYTLGPDHQISFTVAELFYFDDSKERVGWLGIVSDQPEVTGYVSTGDTSLTRLDGVPLFREPIYDWIVPEIVRKEGQFTELNFLNPHFTQASYDVSLVLNDGSILEVRRGNPAFPTNRQVQIFGDIFLQPEETTDGHLRMTAGQGLLFTEFFGSDNALGALNAIDLERFRGIKKIYSPQVSVVPGLKTILNVINASGEDAEVTITLHRADGSVLGQPLKRALVNDEQIKDDVAALFKDEPEAKNVTGWVEIESTQDRIVGTVTFTNEDQRFLTSFELSGRSHLRFLFPLIAQDSSYRTGVALLNTSPEPATVTLEVWGPGGTKDASTTFVLPPKTQTARYLDSYFPDLEPRLIGNLRVRSEVPIQGIGFMNDRDFNFITALPAIPFP